MSKATFAAGCFWGVEHEFKRVKGVTDTRVGYTGGHVESPSYEQVCTGKTGHAEAVECEFDESVVSYPELLEVFWGLHDPTQKDAQGPDIGTQYRSAIFTHTDEQEKMAAASLKENQSKFEAPIVTKIEKAAPFYRAEEYHQCYLQKKGH